MSRTFYITAAAAMFASVAVFAQAADKPGSAPDATASAPAHSDSAATMHHHHHHHHGMRSAGNGNTDFDADKLNGCMSNATPTDQQERCLKHATSN